MYTHEELKKMYIDKLNECLDAYDNKENSYAIAKLLKELNEIRSEFENQSKQMVLKR